MMLDREMFLNCYGTYDFDNYIQSLDVSKQSKESIFTIHAELRNILTGSDVFNITEKIIKHNKSRGY